MRKIMVDITSFKANLEKILSICRENLASVRTGRASSALVENVMITTYGGQATLKLIELATITNNGSQELLVVPFDPSVTADIEKKLRESNLGFSVAVNGNQIRLKAPPLTEEQREKYVKVIGQHTEEARERLRKERDELRKGIKSSLEEKEITEDQKYRLEEEIDKIAKDYGVKIDEIKDKKEIEIRTI